MGFFSRLRKAQREKEARRGKGKEGKDIKRVAPPSALEGDGDED
jgi:hypothetical protein